MAKVYPEFNEAHPPEKTSRDADPPGRSRAEVLADTDILPADFDRVTDPKYPWQTMPVATPEEWAAREEVRANKHRNVKFYRVTRQRYWQRTKSFTPGAMTETITFRTGTTLRRQTTRSETFETTVSLGLGLEIAGAPPIPIESGTPTFNGEFSVEFRHALAIEEVDERTYTSEREVSTERTFEEGVKYFFWQITERLAITRHEGNEAVALDPATGDVVTPMQSITALTENYYVDFFRMKSKSEEEEPLV